MITALKDVKYMERVEPSKLTLSEIPNTINQAYLDGVEDMDQRYRNAIIIACQAKGMNANEFFRTVLHNLNEQ